MAVTFQLPSERPVGLVGFAWSPLLEAALSLGAIATPRRSPAPAVGTDDAGTCSPRTCTAEIRRHGRRRGARTCPGVFEVGLQGDLPTFESELARFGGLDLDLFVHEMSLGHGGAACRMDGERARAWTTPRSSGTPATSASSSAWRPSRDPESGGVRRQRLFDEPAAGARQQVMDMLQRYWDLAFADEWERCARGSRRR